MGGCFGEGSLLRSALVSLAIVAVVAAVGFAFAPNFSIEFMRLKVVNDTEQTLKIQPCWDANCWNRIGLDPTIVPPHHTPIVDSRWENTYWRRISVAVLKPNEPIVAPFDECVVTDFPPGQKVGVIRVSAKTVVPCPELSPAGGAG